MDCVSCSYESYDTYYSYFPTGSFIHLPLSTAVELQAALELVSSIVAAQTGKELREPELVLFEGAWLGLTYEQIAESSEYSTNYLMRDVGPRFWRLLSEILGEPVGKANIRSVLEQFNPSTLSTPTGSRPSREVDPPAKRFSPRSPSAISTPAVSPEPLMPAAAELPHGVIGDAPKSVRLYGRTAELNALNQWIGKDRCRLVGVWGISGVGKTAVVRKLIDQTDGLFDTVIWRSLHAAPTLERVARSNSEDYPGLVSGSQALSESLLGEPVASLVAKLQSHPCLLVLDGVEAILQSGQTSGHYREGYENYGDFFQAICATAHPSCVVVTGLEPPREFDRLESETSTVRSQVLSGLDIPGAEQILEEEHLVRSHQWATLIDYYRGHPAALRSAARIIRRLFSGRVDEFLQQQSFIFEDMGILLEKSFDRLSGVEKEILYWLASEDKPTTLSTIQQFIPLFIYPIELLEALDSLKRRSLLEVVHPDNHARFTLQPMLRDYVINEFIAQVRSSASTQENYPRWPMRSSYHALDLTPAVPKVVHLSEWFHHRFEPGWESIEILFAPSMRSSYRLRSAFHLRGEEIIKRFKQVQLGTQREGHAVALLVAVNQENEIMHICVQVQPIQGETVLPAKLKLRLMDGSEHTLAEVEAQGDDSFIQLPYFRGVPQECFNIQLSLNAASHTESFMI